MYHNLFNQTSVDGHLGHFQSLAILNNIIMTVLLHALFLTCASISVGYTHEWNCWVKGHI